MTNVNYQDETRNQSTAVYTRTQIFLFDNRFDSAEITGAASIKAGGLLVRDTSGKVVLATSANLAKVVGISAETFDVAASVTKVVTYGVSGTVDQTTLVLPAGVTLLTPIAEGGVLLKDHLNSLGFHLENVEQNSY